MNTVFVTSVTIVVALAAHAQAGIVVFTDRTLFDAAAGSLSGFESFETVFSSGASIDFGPFSVNETGDTSNFLFQSGGNPTDGTASLGYIPTTTNSLVTYSFDSPINAFGFDIANNFTGSTVTVGGDVSATITISSANSPEFFGVIDDMGTFDTLTLLTDTSGGNMQMDSVAFGTLSATTAVPEPSSVTVIGVVGLCGIALRVRRRHRCEKAKPRVLSA